MLDLFNSAKNIEENPQNHSKKLEGKIIASLFFEPSTRTKDSFVSATHRSGGKVVGFDSVGGSSAVKGESLADMIIMESGYSDMIVLRHSKDGSARLASEYAKRANTGEIVPVINGGDGQNQHPTQTMLDLYTIQKELGKLDGLTIATVGDHKYGRTLHSLLYGAAMFGMKIKMVAPEIVEMPEKYLKTVAQKYGTKPEKFGSIEEVISEADIIYMTRIQKERFQDPGEYKKVAGAFVLDANMMTKAKENMIVLHPLPRDSSQERPEIHPLIDKDKRAVYFKQAENGVPIRRALMHKYLGVE